MESPRPNSKEGPEKEKLRFRRRAAFHHPQQGVAIMMAKTYIGGEDHPRQGVSRAPSGERLQRAKAAAEQELPRVVHEGNPQAGAREGRSLKAGPVSCLGAGSERGRDVNASGRAGGAIQQEAGKWGKTSKQGRRTPTGTPGDNCNFPACLGVQPVGTQGAGKDG